MMCGIAGYFSSEAHAAFPLAAAIRRIGHRGPDELSISEKDGVGLAAARLALVGGRAGQQPLRSARACRMVLNGEIYNWRELCTDAGGSDTRAALSCLEQHGVDALQKFRGGYALAFHDAENGSLLLARDQFGQKPLYYRMRHGTLVFGSEPTALFAPGERPQMDEAALATLLKFQFLPPGVSLFAGVNALRPGAWLRVHSDAGCLKVEQGTIALPEPASVERTADLFLQSAHRQKRNEPDAAIMLSGGLDSSAVLGALAATGTKPASAWVGWFPDGPESWDERSWARLAAREQDVELVEHAITASDFAGALSDCVEALGEPIAGPGAVSQYLLCRAASANHRVVFGGQGGDELYGGYARLSILQTLLSGSGVLIDQAYAPLYARMEAAAERLPFDALAPYREAVDRSRPLLSAGTDYTRSLLAHAATVEGCLGGGGGETLDCAVRFEREVLLPGLLQVDDRCCSAFGMEGRSLFLDQDLFSAAAAVSLQEKSPPEAPRQLFKHTLRRFLPQAVAARRDKLGFPHPLAGWWRGPLREWAHEQLESQASRSGALIREDSLDALLENDGQGGRLVYFLVALESWQRAFTDQDIAAGPGESVEARVIVEEGVQEQ